MLTEREILSKTEAMQLNPVALAFVGDTVYYTEGGSYYYNNGTIGTLKKASKKEILNGSSKFGYGLIGFIDAANY